MSVCLPVGLPVGLLIGLSVVFVSIDIGNEKEGKRGGGGWVCAYCSRVQYITVQYSIVVNGIFHAYYVNLI